jgi:hypothetical protein
MIPPQGRIRLKWRRTVLIGLLIAGCFLVWGDYQQFVHRVVVHDFGDVVVTKNRSVTERAIVVPDTVDVDDIVVENNKTQQLQFASNADDAIIQTKEDSNPSFPVSHDKDPEGRRSQPPLSALSSSQSNSSLSSSSFSSSSPQQQQQQHFHRLATWLIHRNKIFLFELGDDEQGFGSVMNHLLLLILYFTDAHARQCVVVDESSSSAYRWNQTHGMFSGYFDTTFPILQESSTKDFPLIRQQVMRMDQSHHHQVVPNNKVKNNATTTTTTSPITTITTTTPMDPLFWKFTDPDFYSHKSLAKPWTEEQYRNSTYDLPVVKVTTRSPRTTYWPYRRMLMKYYKEYYQQNNTTREVQEQQQQQYLRMFQRLSQVLCQSIQVNEEIKGRILTLHQNAGIPTTKRHRSIISNTKEPHPSDSTTTTSTTTDAMRRSNSTTSTKTAAAETAAAATSTNTHASTTTKSTSVAFHVRRGDKLEHESRKYEAWEYVLKLMNVTTDEERSHIRQCFVATDDYSVVAEIQSLLTHTASIACTVSTLTPPPPTTTSTNTNTIPGALPSGNRQGGEEFILFLAQLDVLIHSTYFIGTFNSHVGKLVTLYRGCPYHTRDCKIENENCSSSRSNSSDSDKRDDWKDPHPHFTVDQMSTKLNHYYLSYGVDTEDWFFSQVEWKLW